MSVQLVPVGPDIPEALAAVLKSHEAAIREAQVPTGPAALAVIDTAANLLLRAPASTNRGRFIQVTDKASIAHSVETSPGTWQWLRADGGAL